MKKNKLTSVFKSFLLPISIILIASISNIGLATSNKVSPLGINTNEAMDINASAPFINLFKLALPFEEARPWLTKGHITYDKNGWPIRLNGGKAGTRFISNLPGPTIPHGTYTVLYDGSGEITYGVDAKLIRRSPGKDLIRIRPGRNTRISGSLTITKTDPNNHIRNIRILMPGGVCHGAPNKRVNYAKACRGKKYYSFEKYHDHIIFNPDYINFMKDFKVIRFMNMSGITRNDLSDWSKRPQVSQATWGGKEGRRGVPVEILVKLANRIGADPWFNMPHKANNNFIRQHAAYVKKHLKPGLKAYIEYTNEAWNGIFTQAHYMKKMGEKQRLDHNNDIAGYKFFSKRSVEIFRIWEQVFGNTQRIVRVMGGMTTNTNLSHMLLGYQNAYKYTDALAIAPYFYASQSDTKKFRNVNQVFQSLTAKSNKYSVQNILKYVKAQSELCKKYGVDLVAYEGGQHLVAYGTHTVREGPNPYIIQANKDKRMAGLYYRFLKGWKKVGGQLFVAFSAPRQYTWIGSWGIKEYITQPIAHAPKYRALLAFSRGDRCWWTGCANSFAIARKAKPKHNPGAKTMARLFKPINGSNHYVKQAQNKKNKASWARKRLAQQYRNTVRRQEQIKKRQQRLAARNARKQPIWRSYKKNYKGTFRQSLTRMNNKLSPSMIHKVTNSKQIFSAYSPNRLTNIIHGNIKDQKDLSAGWQAHWDSNYLYVRVDISDDKLIQDSKQPWKDDSIELYIDADGSRHASYDGLNDFQFIYRLKDKTIGLGPNSPKRNIQGIKHYMTKSHNQYTLTTSIPWKTLGIVPRAGQKIGIDVHINDDDDGYNRDGKLAWSAQEDKSWKSPRYFSQVSLSM